MKLSPVRARRRVRLTDDEARPPDELASDERLAHRIDTLSGTLDDLQAALYAERRRALLVVLQARDAGGKDGTIRHVFRSVNPQGCEVHTFHAPTDEELGHDYLWRAHVHAPARGMIGIFNRSHYEDVLVARVRALAAERDWKRRYAQINDFERILAENGTTIVKFFLHVSRREQKRRLLERLRDPTKNWKFDPGDLDDRARWDEYTRAYVDALQRCSTPWAPWYVVPADDKEVRNYLVLRTIVETLERMDPKYPKAPPSIRRYARKIR